MLKQYDISKHVWTNLNQNRFYFFWQQFIVAHRYKSNNSMVFYLFDFRPKSVSTHAMLHGWINIYRHYSYAQNLDKSYNKIYCTRLPWWL